MLRKLQTYKPAVIGLDLVRDIPVEPGYQERVKVFQESKNLIAIEKVLPDTFSPPSELPKEQIGFSDVLVDADGHIRRSLLGTWKDESTDEYVFSLPLRLAETYLKTTRNITLENGIRDPNTMRFKETELPRFFAHTGGYVGADDGQVQVLLNYRRGKVRFRTFSFQDIVNDRVEPTFRTSKCSSKKLRFSGYFAIAKKSKCDRYLLFSPIMRSQKSLSNVLLGVLRADVRKVG